MGRTLINECDTSLGLATAVVGRIEHLNVVVIHGQLETFSQLISRQLRAWFTYVRVIRSSVQPHSGRLEARTC